MVNGRGCTPQNQRFNSLCEGFEPDRKHGCFWPANVSLWSSILVGHLHPVHVNCQVSTTPSRCVMCIRIPLADITIVIASCLPAWVAAKFCFSHLETQMVQAVTEVHCLFFQTLKHVCSPPMIWLTCWLYLWPVHECNQRVSCMLQACSAAHVSPCARSTSQKKRSSV